MKIVAIEKYKCPECGAWLENTAAGNYSTCPKGHGKLKRKLDRPTEREVGVRKALEENRMITSPPEKGWHGRYEWVVDGQTYLLDRNTTDPIPHLQAGIKIAYRPGMRIPFSLLREATPEEALKRKAK